MACPRLSGSKTQPPTTPVALTWTFPRKLVSRAHHPAARRRPTGQSSARPRALAVPCHESFTTANPHPADAVLPGPRPVQRADGRMASKNGKPVSSRVPAAFPSKIFAHSSIFDVGAGSPARAARREGEPERQRAAAGLAVEAEPAGAGEPLPERQPPAVAQAARPWPAPPGS